MDPISDDGWREAAIAWLENPSQEVIARGVKMLNTPRGGPDETLVHDIWQAMLDEALAEPARPGNAE